MSMPPVLIVGAGPAGLTLALELARAGIPLRIVDKAPQRPDAESRAIGLHPRSLEVYARNGVAQPFLDAGMQLTAANFYSSGEPVLKIGLSGEATQPFPFSLLVQQGKSERFLIERLQALGIEVERHAEIIGLGQNLTGASAVLRGPAGQMEQVAASYIIGCDGAHSFVRQALGVSFDGRPFDGRYATGDVKIDFEESESWSTSEIHTLLRPGCFAIFGKLRDGHWRVVVDVTDQPEVTADNVTVEDLQEGFAPFTEFKGRLSAPQWISVFRVSSRVAGSLRKGRVFLAGDAAHIHSPESGQGMNAGVQDAVNLAWKLAAVLKGQAGDALLDSYEAERLPIVRAIVRDTEMIQHAIELENPVWITLRDVTASAMGRIAPLQKLLHSAFNATIYHYRESALGGQYGQPPVDYLSAIAAGTPHPNVIQHSAYRRAPSPGDWAPDASGLVLPDGTETTLHGLMANDLRPLVILLGGRFIGEDDLAQLNVVRQQLTEAFSGLLDCHLITTERVANAIHDRDGLLHARYGGAYQCLFLIRPDGFVGYRSQPAIAAPITAHLTKVLGKDQKPMDAVIIHGKAS